MLVFLCIDIYIFAVTEPGAGFDSRGLGLRAQKKLLGKMSSKKIAMTFIDETTGRVLDNTHKILRQYKGHKKEADKLLKYIIKSVVKVIHQLEIVTRYIYVLVLNPLKSHLFTILIMILIIILTR